MNEQDMKDLIFLAWKRDRPPIGGCENFKLEILCLSSKYYQHGMRMCTCLHRFTLDPAAYSSKQALLDEIRTVAAEYRNNPGAFND
jgi:hypothetical protein